MKIWRLERNSGRHRSPSRSRCVSSSSDGSGRSSPQRRPPSSPQRRSPSSPRRWSPSSPQRQSPASPQRQSPSSPRRRSPASPRCRSPASPWCRSPASPRRRSPTSPRRRSPASPRHRSPARDDRAPQVSGKDSSVTASVVDNEDETKAPFYKQLLPIAQKKIDAISLTLESPIVVMGDASASMEVAIKTSAIIAGLLTALTSAKLVFFDNQNRDAPYLPKTIEEVIQLAVETRTGGRTIPAASLWPFYEKKEVVKTFIVVTDEEENGECHAHSFSELYKKYHDEVYPAKLVFVSFLHSQHDSGDMVTELKDLGFKPLQYKFSRDKPDLTKLDKLFGLLAMDRSSSSFDEEVMEMQQVIQIGGVTKAFESKRRYDAS